MAERLLIVREATAPLVTPARAKRHQKTELKLQVAGVTQMGAMTVQMMAVVMHLLSLTLLYQ